MKSCFQESTVHPSNLTIQFGNGIGGRRTATGWPVVVIVKRGPSTITVVDEADIEWQDGRRCQLKADATLYTFSKDAWLATGFYHYD